MDAARAAWTIMQLFDVLCKTKRTPNYPGILGSDEKATHNGKLLDISLSEASNCDRYGRKSDNLCRFCNLKTYVSGKIAGEFPLKMKGGILTQAQSYIFK